MKYSLINIVFFLFISSGISIYSQSNKQNETIIGKIKLFEKDNLILLKIDVENEEPIFKDNLKYNLIALKKSKSGNYSSNRQSGEFSLKPRERKNVSEIRLNIQNDEEIKVYLFVKQDNMLVSKDSLFIVPSNKFEETEKVSEEEFELKGIVIEDVITKVGKDFHDYFYQYYSSSGVKYPFIITIKEKPYFGRSSVITIEVDDRKIYEFMTKPDEEFLKGAVNQSLQNLRQYARQRKLLFTNRRI